MLVNKRRELPFVTLNRSDECRNINSNPSCGTSRCRRRKPPSPVMTLKLYQSVDMPLPCQVKTELSPSSSLFLKIEKLLLDSISDGEEEHEYFRGLIYNTINIKKIYLLWDSDVGDAYLEEKYRLRVKSAEYEQRRMLTLEELDGVSGMKTESFEATELGENLCDRSLNEVYLFHGSDPDGNLDYSRLSRHRADPTRIIGPHIFLSESAEKADRAKDLIHSIKGEQNLSMLLVRVLLGELHRYDPKLLNLYASLRDSVEGFTELGETIVLNSDHCKPDFLVLDHRRCFPQFQIIYDRVYGQHCQRRKKRGSII